MKRTLENLSEADFLEFPIWEFSSKDDYFDDELGIVPVEKWPIETVDNRFIGCALKLNNGQSRMGIVSHFDPQDSLLSKHYLFLSIYSHGKIVHLPRYHDIEYSKDAPFEFARQLALPAEEVFPISYDLSKYVIGPSEVLVGQVGLYPDEMLDRKRLFEILFSNGKKKFLARKKDQ